MKLPAVVLVAAFGSGIVVDQNPAVAVHASSRAWLISVLLFVCIPLVAGSVLIGRDKLVRATVLS